MCILTKEQSILSKGTILNAFFPGIMPLFQLGLSILCQAPHSRALALACGALVFRLLIPYIESLYKSHTIVFIALILHVKGCYVLQLSWVVR